MLPFKKILCPTDFSEASYEALKAANELARHFSSELLLVHVITPIPFVTSAPRMPTAFNVPEYQQEVLTMSQRSLEDVIREKVPKEVKARAEVGIGTAADQIVAIADKEAVDLIAISTHGQTGWRRFLFGSVAEKVVRLASQAVLVVQAPRGEG